MGADPNDRALSAWNNRAYSNALPSPEEIMAAFRRGQITRQGCHNLLRMQGIIYPLKRDDGGEFAADADSGLVSPQFEQWGHIWDAVMDGVQAYPAPGEILQLLQRRQINLPYADALLKRNQYTDPALRRNLLTLRFNIPPMSDLVRFAVREVWDPAVVARYDYDAEIPTPFYYWMNRSGYDGDARTGAERAAGAPEFNWADAYWRAHWEVVSKSEAFEMFQRLRPGRPITLPGAALPVRPFTIEDLRTILKVHDYPVPFRDQLAAIAYRKPRLVDIRRQFDSRAIDEPEALEQFLDYGYSPAKARQMVDWLKRERERKALKTLHLSAKKVRDQTRAQILAGYQLGAMQRDPVLRALVRLDTDQALEDRADWDVPAVAPIETAMLRSKALAEVELLDTQLALAIQKKTYESIHKRFLRGMVNAAVAKRLLHEAGFDGERVDKWLILWTREIEGPRLIFSTEKIQTLVGKGIVPLDVAQTWWTNLGWPAEAIAYMSLDAQRSLILMGARAEEKLAKTAAAKAQALKRQLQELKKQQTAIEHQVARSGTQAQLLRWFILGVVGEGALRSGLARQGIPPDGVNRTVAEARIKRTEYLEKAQKAAQAKTGATNGQA